ncbi:MAG: universal stress protein [Chloroflexi bacterium SZAS-1]|jgi:nucleotide-binding universal stress UspA family protein|nr:universal stress protein [Chloroflexi bacterium SZAS-1]
MQVLIYAGVAPSRDAVLQFCTPIIERCVRTLTLVSGGGAEREALLREAASRLHPPEHVSVTLRALPGNAQTAILAAAREQPFDLVILGRLHQPLGRLLPGVRSKVIAQRLEPSVLRVQGPPRQLRRILLASGGDFHTFGDVSAALQLAKPLGAEVTVLHILSQQSLLFEGFGPRPLTVDAFLAGNSPEAHTLRDAVAMLKQRGVAAQLRGRVGPVLDEILAELREGNYDLLVIGAHRVASALDRILLEDITEDLLDISPLPVMVVKSKGAPL